MSDIVNYSLIIILTVLWLPFKPKVITFQFLVSLQKSYVVLNNKKHKHNMHWAKQPMSSLSKFMFLIKRMLILPLGRMFAY